MDGQIDKILMRIYILGNETAAHPNRRKIFSVKDTLKKADQIDKILMAVSILRNATESRPNRRQFLASRRDVPISLRYTLKMAGRLSLLRCADCT